MLKKSQPLPLQEPRRIAGVAPNVFFLGIISFLTDVSSEMIFTLLPLFLANVLGAATAVIGLIEGMAESSATLLKIFGGWLSDRLNKRKSLVFTGYALSTVAKPFMYLAGSWAAVLGIRFADRAGKGIRTAPRDALLFLSISKDERGKSFGFHKALDTAGAFMGIAGAATVVYLFQRGDLELTRGTYQKLVILGVIPAVLALLVFFFVREIRKRPQEDVAERSRAVEAGGKKKGKLPRRFKILLLLVIVFSLGNSSDAFLILRAQNLGISLFHILLILLLFNAVYALFSTPAGSLSDKIGRKRVIGIGWFLYGLVYLGFALAQTGWQVWLLFAVYGLYYGMSEGTTRALVADLVPPERAGTAFGLYHGAVGASLLPASLLAGWMWQTWGPSIPFFWGAGAAFAAVGGLIVLLR